MARPRIPRPFRRRHSQPLAPILGCSLGLLLSCAAATAQVTTIELTPATPAAPAASVPAPAPTAEAGATPAGSATAPKPSPPLLEAIRKSVFSRAPQVILDESAAALLPPPAPSDAPPQGAPPPDPHAADVATLQRAVATGRWPDVGAFLSTKFKDEPEAAKQAYLHILDSLAADPRQQQMQQMQQARAAGAVVQSMPQPMMMEGGPQSQAFRQSQLIHPADVLALADISPGDIDQPVLDRLAGLLGAALQRGERPEALLDTLDAGTLKLGGQDQARRLLAARLLLAAGQPVALARFLPPLDEALTARDADRLNLLASHFLGQHQQDGQPVWLERAWQATQGVLASPTAPQPARQEALRRAMELAPRVQAELGERWLIESFTTEPARGLEILATIGAVISRDRMNFQADVRQTNLELQHRVVSTLLAAAPDRAAEWRAPLTVLALNWMQEAKWSQERDLSTQRGPQMQYDPFGNVYFSNYDAQQQMQMQQQRGPGPIPSGKLLDLRPGDAWLARIEPSLQPALLAQTVELFLKVNEPEAAFPLIETISTTLKDEGRRLAGRFLDVWTEKHDPNAAKRRTNRFMYVYGYNPQADGIPLTRSQQDRNLKELAGWVRRLRALPVGSLDETKIADAFVKTHSLAEVYRLEAMETVFGPLEGMKPDTLASLVQTMRTNLGSVWRAPKVQQDAKTNRTDKDIQAELLRGYSTALDALEPALAAHPDHWGLRLAHSAVVFDQITYENSLARGSDFMARRDEAFAGFKRAAELYAKALPSLEAKDQSPQAYLQWFYASLGACDLEAVKFEYPEAPKQYPLIRDALTALPGESGKKHLTDFANALSTRMSAVQPELKHRYLGAGLQITGDHERAREARELYDYYQDLVTEVQLVTRLDGTDQIGTSPFGVFVEILHTKQIEREAGGFQKYLQNQQGGFYYNFGRPPENYREKFEEAARQALQESFDVLSCTFHTDKIESRGTDQDGWRLTPYAYLLLKPKGPQVDAVPPLKLNLDFLDTSGFAVLPIASARLPVAAGTTAAPRPVRQLEIRQILDERKAREGVLALEIRATAHGLVPDLDSLLVFPPGDFERTATEDQGVHITQLDAESEENSAVSERLWNLTYRAKPGLSSPPRSFTFGTPLSPEFQVSTFRYADADLAQVGPVVDLQESYAKPGLPWGWLLAALTALAAAVAGSLWWRHSRQPAASSEAAFPLPETLTPLTVLGLLRRIRTHASLPPTQSAELDKTIADLESGFFSRNPASHPDLLATARHWITQASPSHPGAYA
jgi:hypothetical protein